MGCWNGTCGLSQLPIKAGDKTVLFIIIERKNNRSRGGGFCYSHDIYTPTTIPIFGEYNDYGSLEEIEPESGDIVFNHFLAKITDGTIMVKPSRFEDDKNFPENIDELLEMIQDDRLSVKGSFADVPERKISYMLVHRDIYDSVLTEIGSRIPYKKAFNMREYWETQFSKLESNIKEINDKINAFKENKENHEDTNHIKIELHKLMNFRENALLQDCSDFGLIYGDFKDVIFKNINSENIHLKNGVIDLLLMHTVLDFARKAWMPQSGAGSQSEERRIHEVIANSVIQKIEEYKTSVLEDSDYTPEELESLIKETLWVIDDEE